MRRFGVIVMELRGLEHTMLNKQACITNVYVVVEGGSTVSEMELVFELMVLEDAWAIFQWIAIRFLS